MWKFERAVKIATLYVVCGFVWCRVVGTEVGKDAEVVGRGLFNKNALVLACRDRIKKKPNLAPATQG